MSFDKLILIFKLSVLLLTVFFLLNAIDTQKLFKVVNLIDFFYASLFSVFCFFLQSLFATFRQLIEIISIFNKKINFFQSFKIWFISLFVSQVLITFVAGDLFRAFKLYRHGLKKSVSAFIVFLDRLIGMQALIFLVIISCFILFFYSSIMRNVLPYIILLSLIFLFCCLLIHFLSKPLKKITTTSKVKLFFLNLLQTQKYYIEKPFAIAKIFLLSIFMHFLNILSVFGSAFFFGINLPFLSTTAILFICFFLILLPISFAGWGVREATFASGLSFVGLTYEESIILSLTFGISLFFSSIPGLFFLLKEKFQMNNHNLKK